MIEAHELTKRYGDTTAVHSLSFTIAPGTVTGFLRPNGAGKSTTMRMIMGLDRPTSGTVTVNGKPYRQHRAPLREVGALLEASAVHPGRSARSHLRTMAAAHNIKAPGQRGQCTPRPAATPADGPLLSKEEPMTIRTNTPEPARQPAIRPQRRSKR
jgi:ABC-type multidrug transport system ATPase subunit